MGLADRLVMEKEEKHPGGLQVRGVSEDKDVVAVSGVGETVGRGGSVERFQKLSVEPVTVFMLVRVV